MKNELKIAILEALDLKIASAKRGISSKSPAFKPVYELEIKIAEEAKVEINKLETTK